MKNKGFGLSVIALAALLVFVYLSNTSKVQPITNKQPIKKVMIKNPCLQLKEFKGNYTGKYESSAEDVTDEISGLDRLYSDKIGEAGRFSNQNQVYTTCSWYTGNEGPNTVRNLTFGVNNNFIVATLISANLTGGMITGRISCQQIFMDESYHSKSYKIARDLFTKQILATTKK